MEFVLGATVFMIGVLVGAAIAQQTKTKKDDDTKLRPFGHDN